MTASSLEFFPCRVQLMGLSRPFAGTTSYGNIDPTSQINDGSVISSSSTHGSQPLEEATVSLSTIAKLHGISRNLFGTPNRIEMNQLYQEEIQRQRSYVIHRYNFDIDTTKPLGTTKQQQKHIHQLCQRRPTALVTPNLIQQELQQYEDRLQEEKCNLVRAVVTTTTVLNHQSTKTMIYNNSGENNISLRDCKVMCYHNKNKRSIIYSSNSKDSSAAYILPSERCKPYERQMLITDCFSLRKNKSCGMGGGNETTCGAMKGKTVSKIGKSQNMTSALSLQQNLKILKATNSTLVSLVQESSSRIYSKMKANSKNTKTDNEQNNNNNSIIVVNGDNMGIHGSNNENVIDIYKSVCITSDEDGHLDCHPETVTIISEALLKESAVPTLPSCKVTEFALKATKRKSILNENDCSKSSVTFLSYAPSQVLK